MARTTARRKSTLKVKTARNNSHRVPRDTRQAFAVLRELQRQERAQRAARLEIVRKGSVHERALRADVAKWAGKQFPEMGRHVMKIKNDLAGAARDIHRLWGPRKLLDVKVRPPAPHPPEPTRDGMFWWAWTEYWGTDWIAADFLADGVHFYGHLDYHGDPLIHRSLGAVAHFELQASRRPGSTSGRWASSPGALLFGKIVGNVGFYHFLWAADDKWCKCWLHLRQTALQSCLMTSGFLAFTPSSSRSS
jgi:hypothetical protein